MIIAVTAAPSLIQRFKLVHSLPPPGSYPAASIQAYTSSRARMLCERRRYGSTRNCAPAGGGAWVRRDRIAPIFTDALKIRPTGITPPSLCAATAASAIDAGVILRSPGQRISSA
jgi:hypothetical protein